MANIITIEHVLSNLVPLNILVIVVLGALDAASQNGASKVWTGLVVYLALASFIDYLMTSQSYASIRYLDQKWSDKPGPHIWPSVVYFFGYGYDSEGTEQEEEEIIQQETKEGDKDVVEEEEEVIPESIDQDSIISFKQEF